MTAGGEDGGNRGGRFLRSLRSVEMTEEGTLYASA